MAHRCSRSYLSIVVHLDRSGLLNARYFFHRMDGSFDRDNDGTIIDSVTVARAEAIIYAERQSATVRKRSGKAANCMWSYRQVRLPPDNVRRLDTAKLCHKIEVGSGAGHAVSEGIERSQARVDRARDLLTIHQLRACAISPNDPRHRQAMDFVFLCEETYFVLMQTHDLIVRLEAQRQ